MKYSIGQSVTIVCGKLSKQLATIVAAYPGTKPAYRVCLWGHHCVTYFETELA